MAFIIDDILFFPLKFTVWMGRKLAHVAYEELTDVSMIHEDLLQLQMRFEMEEIGEEEFEKEEAALMERLTHIRKIKGEE